VIVIVVVDVDVRAHVGVRVKAGLALVRRTGSERTRQSLAPYRWLAGVLRGERSTWAVEAVPIDRYADNPLALLHMHIDHAVAAAAGSSIRRLLCHVTDANVAPSRTAMDKSTR
jgi:hypothetical protein